MSTLPRSDLASNQKRDPGFAPIRRGILEHWSTLSGNAAKLYIWFHLTAFWQDQKRGLVEASFDDMARGNGWSLKVLRRAIEELEAKPFIEVERAPNQHGLTRVKILKYDREEYDSAPTLRGSSNEIAPSPADSLAPTLQGSSEGRSKPAISQSQHGLRAPKKSKNKRREEHDAVRRPIDAELRHASNSFSPQKRKQNLESRLLEKGLKNETLLNHNLDEDEHAAFAAIGYKPRDLRKLADGFVNAVEVMVDKHKGTEISPGNLCSKIIDYCVAQQEGCKKLGASASDYYWPPDFQEHRDQLRAQERAQKKLRDARCTATKEHRRVEERPKRSTGEERAARVREAGKVLRDPSHLPAGIRDLLSPGPTERNSDSLVRKWLEAPDPNRT
jgi:hypothetical protein